MQPALFATISSSAPPPPPRQRVVVFDAPPSGLLGASSTPLIVKLEEGDTEAVVSGLEQIGSWVSLLQPITSQHPFPHDDVERTTVARARRNCCVWRQLRTLSRNEEGWRQIAQRSDRRRLLALLERVLAVIKPLCQDSKRIIQQQALFHRWQEVVPLNGEGEDNGASSLLPIIMPLPPSVEDTAEWIGWFEARRVFRSVWHRALLVRSREDDDAAALLRSTVRMGRARLQTTLTEMIRDDDLRNNLQQCLNVCWNALLLHPPDGPRNHHQHLPGSGWLTLNLWERRITLPLNNIHPQYMSSEERIWLRVLQTYCERKDYSNTASSVTTANLTAQQVQLLDHLCLRRSLRRLEHIPHPELRHRLRGLLEERLRLSAGDADAVRRAAETEHWVPDVMRGDAARKHALVHDAMLPCDAPGRWALYLSFHNRWVALLDSIRGEDSRLVDGIERAKRLHQKWWKFIAPYIPPVESGLTETGRALVDCCMEAYGADAIQKTLTEHWVPTADTPIPLTESLVRSAAMREVRGPWELPEAFEPHRGLWHGNRPRTGTTLLRVA